MFRYVLLNGLLLAYPVEPYEEPEIIVEHVCALSDRDRDVIHRQYEWATYRSIACLEMADEELARLKKFDGKSACQAALQGAITAIAGATCKERVVIGVITVLARYLDEACDAVWNAYYLTLDAKAYACKADELQQRLWLDD